MMVELRPAGVVSCGPNDLRVRVRNEEWRQKKAGEDPDLRKRSIAKRIQSDFFDFNCLRPFWTTLHFKADLFSLGEGAKTIGLNGTVMNEHITLIFGLDKTKTLLVIEPFHSAFRHC